MPKALEEHALPTADEVRELLDYNPETGALTWKVRQATDPATKWWNTRYAEKQAGCRNASGYMEVRLFDRLHLAHRLAWIWVNGEWPSSAIDHADGNPSNNCLANLRPTNDSLNQANKKKPSTNRSGYKGVSFRKDKGRYVAQIMANGQYHYLGLFDCPRKAHAAYTAAAKLHFGEYAYDGLSDRRTGRRRVPQGTDLASRTSVGGEQ